MSSRNLTATGLIAFFLISYISPLWFNRHDLSPGDSQNKCDKEGRKDDPRAIVRPDSALKIIRLTNSGEFVDSCDLTSALYELNWDRQRPAGAYGVAFDPNAAKHPKIAVLYIHGWKHGFDAQDADLVNFQRLIDQLREQHRGRKYVVGIYVGWNASAGLPGILENTSFWVKGQNADRIAQSSAVTKIVTSIGAITKSDPNREDRFVAIGHSFGARMLFSATAQSLIYEAAKAHPGFPGGQYKIIEGAADAVILLNPAFEASRYTAIDDITRFDETFSDNQPPLMITVATDEDYATRFAFPLGRALSLAWSVRELTTLGNYPPFFTHTLLPDQGTGCGSSATNSLTESYDRSGLCLARTPVGNGKLVQPHNPFVVARTNNEIIPGHNGIWNQKFTDWLINLVADLELSNDAMKVKHPPDISDPTSNTVAPNSLTVDEIIAKFPQLAVDDARTRLVDLLNAAHEFKIPDVRATSIFIALVLQRTDYLKDLEENLAYSSEKRLRQIFPALNRDVDVAPFINNPQALANKIYSNRHGNVQQNDGWTYRRRGYDDDSFFGHDDYARASDLVGIDLVADPDALLQSKVAARLAAASFAASYFPQASVRDLTRRLNAATPVVLEAEEIFTKLNPPDPGQLGNPK